VSNTLKTYGDSYLYNNKFSAKVSGDSSKYNKALMDFITLSQRIDKNSDAFRGIVEDIKRQQTSSVLYSVLMMPNVQLCIYNTEMPRSFKVFDAYDIKNDKKPTVFIDVTGLIDNRNGYYVCKKIDVLITYLFGALDYLVYRYANTSILSNSNVLLPATTCYVNMFTYIIDYLRVIGYSANKTKIGYLTALYFMVNMMGKNLDDSIKNVAAKLVDVKPNEMRAYDLYISDHLFDNIYTFIDGISKEFNMKGFNLEVFINKWMYLYGTGTQYACELFSSFIVLITNAYCGAYIVQQKQVERCCGTNMVKLANEILKIGANTFDQRSYREVSQATIDLAKIVKSKNEAIDHITENDFCCKSDDNSAKALKKANCLLCRGKQTGLNISKEAKKAMNEGLIAMSNYFNDKRDDYIEGSLLETAKVFKNYITESDQYFLAINIDDNIRAIRDKICEARETGEVDKKYANCMNELRQVKSYI